MREALTVGARKQIIFDCDNTMGIPGCDVDDGLALLYLLGQGGAEICGITTTYGNSSLETVYANTRRMLAAIGRPGINVFRGCPSPAVLDSEAVAFLVETVNAHPGRISILATGSLTNLKGAYCKDPDFFDKVAEVVLMGGITDELIINGKVLPELNFSCDPLAASLVLAKGKKVTVLTGNRCLAAYFSGEEFARRLQNSVEPVARYIYETCRYWFADMMKTFQLDGFHNWDVVAAAYLLEPELFIDEVINVTSSIKLLKDGRLVPPVDSRDSHLINTPRIKNVDLFKEHIYQAWLNVRQ